MNKYYTLFIIKNDVFQRGIWHHVLAEIGSRFKIAHFETRYISQSNISCIQDLYAEHSAKPFFNSLLTNMQGYIGIGLIEGSSPDIIKQFRDAIGATDPLKSEPGTLRHMFGISLDANSIHGSDSPASAERERSVMLKNVALAK